MDEHATDIVKAIPYILTAGSVLISSLFAGVIYFIKKDRGKIDADIIALRQRTDDDIKGLQKAVCSKIDTTQHIAESAMHKAEVIEKNYLQRFERVHDHLSTMQLQMQEQFSDLKLHIAKSYPTKTEVSEAIKRESDRNKH